MMGQATARGACDRQVTNVTARHESERRWQTIQTVTGGRHLTLESGDRAALGSAKSDKQDNERITNGE